MTHTDISIDAYHAAPHVSASKIKLYREQGAWAYWQRYVLRNKPDEQPKSHFTFGQVLEDIAQGREFDETRYVVKPAGMEFRSGKDKAWRDEHLAAGREIVTQAQLNDMREMITAMSENRTAIDLIAQCQTQVTLRREYAGLPGIQARPDWYAPGLSVDLKTTDDLPGMLSGHAVRKYAYHMQAAIVARCGRVDVDNAWLLVVEKSSPYRCQLVSLSRSWIEAGWSEAEQSLDRIASHYASGNWPRVESDVAKLRPYWQDGGRKEGDE